MAQGVHSTVNIGPPINLCMLTQEPHSISMKTNIGISSECHIEELLTRWATDDNLLFKAWSEDMHLLEANMRWIVVAYHQFNKKWGMGECYKVLEVYSCLHLYSHEIVLYWFYHKIISYHTIRGGISSTPMLTMLNLASRYSRYDPHMPDSHQKDQSVSEWHYRFYCSLSCWKHKPVNELIIYQTIV